MPSWRPPPAGSCARLLPLQSSWLCLALQGACPLLLSHGRHVTGQPDGRTWSGASAMRLHRDMLHTPAPTSLSKCLDRELLHVMPCS